MTVAQRRTFMDERPDHKLSFWSKPNGLRAFFTRRTLIVSGIITVLLLVFGLIYGPTSVQIRLDTGDLRYCRWGIPFQYREMPEPLRSKLLVLASKSPAIPARWVTGTTTPLSSEFRPDRMFQEFYWSVAIWSDEDPQIARWAMDDVADYFVQHAKWGLPRSVHLLDTSVVDWNGRRVNADWRDQEEVKEFCAAHGYVPPPARPASRP